MGIGVSEFVKPGCPAKPSRKALEPPRTDNVGVPQKNTFTFK